MKITIVSSTDHSVWQFRSEFVMTLLYNGHDVTVVCPDGPYAERIRALGVEHVAIPVNRFVGPVSDLQYVFRLYRTLRRLKPDFVYTMTTKPNILCPGLAKFAGVPHVCSVFGGIGFIYSEGGGFMTRQLKRLARSMMRFGVRFSDHFVFQNPDDRDTFQREGTLKNRHFIVVKGSGVNLLEFNADSIDQRHVENIRDEFKVGPSGLLVVMLSRLSKNKGVLDFIEAGREFGDLEGKIRFVHAGSFEKGSLEEITADQIRETPLFVQAGYRTDARELIQAADIVVLPSYHREGIPNVLMEAMALKKPIVTTDNVGCRETVEEGKNGFLVPVRDPKALAAAIRKLTDSPELRQSMGEYGFDKVRREFAVESVNRTILEEVFGFQNVRIPEFFAEETANGLHLMLDGQSRYCTVTPIGKDHVLNVGKEKRVSGPLKEP